MYSNNFVTYPTTEKWDFSVDDRCISNGILSFAGEPARMQACSECEDMLSSLMHYIESQRAQYTSFSWVAMWLFIVIFFGILLYATGVWKDNGCWTPWNKDSNRVVPLTPDNNREEVEYKYTKFTPTNARMGGVWILR